MHALRVALLAAVVWLIHDASRHRADSSAQVSFVDVPAAILVDLYGAGARIASDNGEVQNPAGRTIGRVLQTSPQSDDVIGFSGPTNALLALDADERVIGFRILSSGDTREHVRQVRQDARFEQAMQGMTIDELTRHTSWDGVSGATLTSLAIVEGLLKRLGGGLGSLKFPVPPKPATVQQLFPDMATMRPDEQSRSWWDVYNRQEERIGGLLRTSPAADNIVGYQGPSQTLVGFDPAGHVIGIVIAGSYDNEPYVGYVRDDEWFRNSFNGQTLAELGELDLEAAGVEGVSGATMTSMAVARGMTAAAGRQSEEAKAARERTTRQAETLRAPAISVRNWGTIAVVLMGLIIGLTSLRGRRWVRVPFQCLLIGYLGFINGDLISQAMLVGWAQHGVPWESMLGVCLLSVAAFLVPITTKHNVYCHQLCPHGAAQQWLRPSSSRRVHLPRWLDRLLLLLPGGLLLLVVAVAVGAVSVRLVDIEPFDAYLITIAGTATITIAVVGLIASAFVPMAYCRYGCPTGAAIEYVRRHARSDRLTLRDALALACLLLAWFLR